MAENINPFLRVAAMCGIEDSTIVSSMKHVRWLFGLGANLSLHFLLLGLNLGTGGYATMSYIIATTCRSLLDHLADHVLALVKTEPDQETETIMLVKYAAQYVGFALGGAVWRDSYPKIYRFFHPAVKVQFSDSDLLMNAQLCHNFKAECKQAALKSLGVGENATLAIIEKKYRELARKLHPDTNGGATKDDFVLANLAKARVVELK